MMNLRSSPFTTMVGSLQLDLDANFWINTVWANKLAEKNQNQSQ